MTARVPAKQLGAAIGETRGAEGKAGKGKPAFIDI